MALAKTFQGIIDAAILHFPAPLSNSLPTYKVGPGLLSAPTPSRALLDFLTLC